MCNTIIIVVYWNFLKLFCQDVERILFKLDIVHNLIQIRNKKSTFTFCFKAFKRTVQVFSKVHTKSLLSDFNFDIYDSVSIRFHYRRREKHRLSGGRAWQYDLFDLFEETFVQESVGLVEDQHLDALQGKAGRVFDVINKPESKLKKTLFIWALKKSTFLVCWIKSTISHSAPIFRLKFYF